MTHLHRWILPLLLTGGCVAKSQHELVQIQLDATRSALSARAVKAAERILQLEQTVDELETRITDVDTRLSRMQTERDEFNQQLRVCLEDQVAIASELDDAMAESERLRSALQRIRGTKASVDEDVALLPHPSLEDLRSALADGLARRIARVHLQHAETIAREELSDLLDRGLVAIETESNAVDIVLPFPHLFQEGNDALGPTGHMLAQRLASLLLEFPRATAELHISTDAQPRHSIRELSNWEYGFGRGMVVLRAIEGAGNVTLGGVASHADRLAVPGHEPSIKLRIPVPDDLFAGPASPIEPEDALHRQPGD